ncbi:MAG: 16S rRNA processing protein RimM [Gemmatimonadetes bacterium]|nr:ribosome maturation factor RimM [Gemmatimonadota bacterium]NNM04267.1 16S rRNA processing protein RimM [Gemmatimonadota bacterium]
MGRSEPSFLVVGHLNKAHGTKGEIFVWPLTDHPEGSFAPGVILYLGDDTGNAPDSTRPSVLIETSRPFRRGYLVRFEGVGTRDEAEALRGRYVLRPREELSDVGDGEFLYHQLLGLTVVTVAGEEVGEIVEVYELRPADLLEVEGPSKTHFIPFLASTVQEVDLESGTMVIDPPAGLLDL